MKKKVLFLVNHDVVIYNFRKELVEKLLEEGYEVIISSPYGERIDKLIEMGCKFEQIEFNRHGLNPIKEVKIINDYLRLFKKIQPDIVLTYTIKPNIYGGFASMIKNIPYIANITGLGTAVENPGILQKITIGLYKISFKKINTVFFQNKENMDFFGKYNVYPETHQLVPGSGVNLEQYNLVEYPNSDKIKFVFISRIMKEKGIDLYLNASEVIKEEFPDSEFHICGFSEEDYKSRLDDLESKNIIKYHGMVSDIKTILEDMHCTVHPTYYPEGISNVLLESAAMGKPLITTDRSGCREVVDDEINGFLIREKNQEDLTETIRGFMKMSHEERKNMGVNGRKKVELEFNRNIVVDAYLRNIREILGDN